jgi:site-specific DNA-methyltransferase (adenine-specific)
MATAFEDAGFEIRDQLMWVFGSGFPKSHNIGKAIDKIEGNEREYVGEINDGRKGNNRGWKQSYVGSEGTGTQQYTQITKGNSDWEGWGTALKPAHEPIVMARKPLTEKSIAENVLKYGTGGINIDGSRIEMKDKENINFERPRVREKKDWVYDLGIKWEDPNIKEYNEQGRFPANIIFECICDELIDGKEIKGNENYNWNNTDTESNTFTNRGTYTPRTETPKIHTNPNCPCYMLDEQSGIKQYNKGREEGNYKGGHRKEYVGTENNQIVNKVEGKFFNDKGGASRFFYCPKAAKKDRNEGLIVEKEKNKRPIGVAFNNEDDLFQQGTGNNHPTVKPTDLMRYLINLITPPNGTTLDPFMGSGSTGKAAIRCGVNFIGIEKEQEYMDIASARIQHEQNKPIQQSLF